MNYEIEFAEEAIEDLSFLSVYEIQFTFSPDLAQDRIDKLMESVDQALSTFPARNPEKPYVFTEALRWKLVVGKYAAFYWVDETEGIVHVERIVHSKADFTRIHFGN